ncbi:cation diffusion facilitator family transporter [Desulfosporosinus metallidurans]|uniref:Cobalt-zinc-cadmium resistance protein n=1 Tax=Desulfosporosinus metallidurans TaxID=1888891 RepID=A0A1Q8QL07_9FIRM|nr:cation diffusion facilitator family transporter [Desulfosporosinus metallidurans]OLN28016.1 Cobalt-zinc-cadmium resistance protein [Desulfosporosinus metallidurans]
MVIDKQKAALSSVFAAVFLTLMKTVVGIFTGSLGILSEALHSALDLCAALITLFAVKFSDKPADSKHHYGHGKIESFSALIETVLLLITCVWIIYEAVEKLFFGKGVELIGIQWGVLTMIISILVDASRVRVLKKAAKEHGSQALEADALHFSSDIWSSSVVIVGLICVWIGDYFNIPVLKYADPVAALGVGLLVIKVSIKLGKETIDVLLDTAPDGIKEMIEKEISKITSVIQIAEIRLRPSGAVQYIEINVGVDPYQSHRSVHTIVHEIREKISEKIPRCDIVVSTFPVDAVGMADLSLSRTFEEIVSQISNCTNVHNIHVYEFEGKKKITAHIELEENLTLKDSHELSHRIDNMVQKAIKNVDNVSLYFERAEKVVQTEDITETQQDIVDNIKTAVLKIRDNVDCHDIKLYRNGNKVSTFLHCGVRGDFTVDKLESISNNIKSELKNNVDRLENVHIHFEPLDN